MDGDAPRLDDILPLVYGELRALARDFLGRERRDHTLAPTALVHEAFLRLSDQTRVEWRNRAHFFAIAAQAIRRILIDHARARGAAKRGGDASRVLLEDRVLFMSERTLDVLALDQALTLLADESPRAARVVELRYFGGLTIDETAEVLELSPSSVEREWRFARARLYRALGGPTGAA